MEVFTYIDKKKEDAETMIFKSTGSIPGTGQKHSLADALITHIETVEKLKSMYKKD